MPMVIHTVTVFAPLPIFDPGEKTTRRDASPIQCFIIVISSVPYEEGELTTEPQRHGAVFALRASVFAQKLRRDKTPCQGRDEEDRGMGSDYSLEQRCVNWAQIC